MKGWGREPRRAHLSWMQLYRWWSSVSGGGAIGLVPDREQRESASGLSRHELVVAVALLGTPWLRQTLSRWPVLPHVHMWPKAGHFSRLSRGCGTLPCP